MLDFPEEFPQASINIKCYETDPNNIDFKWLAAALPNYPKSYTIGFLTWNLLDTAKAFGLNAYLLRSINTYAELNALKDVGVSHVILGQPLFFSLDKIKRFGIPIRWIPNLVNSGSLPLSELSHGTWIRPEDISKYDILPDCVIEFLNAKDFKAEQALFRVYKKGAWQQDLGLLFPEFAEYNINNYLLFSNEDYSCDKRLNCHQLCEESPGRTLCHYCNTWFKLANPDLIKAFKNTQT